MCTHLCRWSVEIEVCDASMTIQLTSGISFEFGQKNQTIEIAVNASGYYYLGISNDELCDRQDKECSLLSPAVPMSFAHGDKVGPPFNARAHSHICKWTLWQNRATVCPTGPGRHGQFRSANRTNRINSTALARLM